MQKLSNNRLILNWHRIFNQSQLFDYLSWRLKVDIKSFSDIKQVFAGYSDLKIAIRHSDTFLKEETQQIHDKIIAILSECWEVKQTWKR